MVSLCTPQASADSAPRRLGTRAITVRPGLGSAWRTTSATSAICGSSRAGTKEPTSISRSPAANRASIQAHLCAVGMVALTLCRPSRGPTSLIIARLASVHAASFSLEDVVLPEMRALVDTTQESVAFHVRQGDQRLVLFRVDSPQLLRDHVRAGDLLPLDRGAGGRVLMAYAGAKGRLYDQVRRDGYMMVTGDRIAGIVGISAPVWRSDNDLVGALTLTTPEPRMQPSFVNDLRASADRLTTALGGSGKQ
jgi:hypothetical protein